MKTQSKMVFDYKNNKIILLISTNITLTHHIVHQDIKNFQMMDIKVNEIEKIMRILFLLVVIKRDRIMNCFKNKKVPKKILYVHKYHHSVINS